MSLWDEEDGFFYDVLALPDGRRQRMKVRSLVGLIPLFAVETWDTDVTDRLPGFTRRVRWFMENNPELREHVAITEKPGGGQRFLTSIVTTAQLPRLLRYMLDENEFLSPHGVRALSRYHRDHPYVLRVDGRDYRVDYEPAESTIEPLRRQLELARAGVVSRQLPPGRGAAEVPPLLRRQPQGRVPIGLRPQMLNLWEVAADAVPTAQPASSCPGPTGAAPSTAVRRSSSATRTGGA